MIFLMIISLIAYFIIPTIMAVWLVEKYKIGFDIELTAWGMVVIEFAGLCQFIYWAETC